MSRKLGPSDYASLVAAVGLAVSVVVEAKLGHRGREAPAMVITRAPGSPSWCRNVSWLTCSMPVAGGHRLVEICGETTCRGDVPVTIIGIDAHKRTHTMVAIDDTGAPLGEKTVSAIP